MLSDQWSNPHTLLFSLLYPAVLGAMFYELLPIMTEVPTAIRRWRWPLSEPWSKLTLATLVIFYFIQDFLMVMLVTSSQGRYGVLLLVLDLLILCALFRAFHALNIGERTPEEFEPPVVARALSLAFTLFLLWVIAHGTSLPRSWWITYEVSFIIIFLACAVLRVRWGWLAVWLLIANVVVFVMGSHEARVLREQLAEVRCASRAPGAMGNLCPEGPSDRAEEAPARESSKVSHSLP